MNRRYNRYLAKYIQYIMRANRKVVIATYFQEECFVIPRNIDIEDKTQVKSWGVKWNRLYVELVSGEIIEIGSENWIDETDYKRPSEVVIDDATNRGLDNLCDTEDNDT